MVAVESGQHKRVIVTVPPRHGKSMLISHYFPAWYLGRNPNKQVIASTYAQDFAEDFGRKVRNLCKDEIHRAVFPESIIKEDSSAANRFHIGKSGVYYALGVGGQATGRGADLFLIDDPIKNREEAESPTMQARIMEWYKSVAYTRLMPGGAIVIVMARWNENDLVGQLLAHHAHEGWKVFNMPALIDEGGPTERALWPEQYSVEDMYRIRSTLSEGADGPYAWTSLYQQQPIPKGGVLIKSEWLKYGSLQKEQIAGYYIGVDLAISEKETADETAMCVIAAGFGNPCSYYEVETIYGHWDFDKQLEMLVELNARYRPISIGIESVQYQKALYQVAIKRNLPVFQMAADGDKIRRLNVVSHFLSQGRVYINSPKLRTQMIGFRGKNEKNDLVDAFVHCMRLIRDTTLEQFQAPEVQKFKDLDRASQHFHEARERIKKNALRTDDDFRSIGEVFD